MDRDEDAHTSGEFEQREPRIIKFMGSVSLFCLFIMWGMWVEGMMNFLGWLWGFVVGIFLFPGALIYPIIYKLVAGDWPTTYLVLYGVAIVSYLVGVAIAAAHNKKMGY